MRRGNILDFLRRGRASWSVAIVYLLLLPLVLGILPKPAATAEFLLLRDLAASEICSMHGPGKVPGQPMEHQPDCILCHTACPFSGSLAALPSADAAAHPYYLQFAFLVPLPKDLALPAFRLFTSDIQPRGPPTSI